MTRLQVDAFRSFTSAWPALVAGRPTFSRAATSPSLTAGGGAGREAAAAPSSPLPPAPRILSHTAARLLGGWGSKELEPRRSLSCGQLGRLVPARGAVRACLCVWRGGGGVQCGVWLQSAQLQGHGAEGWRAECECVQAQARMPTLAIQFNPTLVSVWVSSLPLGHSWALGPCAAAVHRAPGVAAGEAPLLLPSHPQPLSPHSLTAFSPRLPAPHSACAVRALTPGEWRAALLKQ